MREKGTNGTKDGRNQRGPDPKASGPFRNGAPPIQCYKCWGWGSQGFSMSFPFKLPKGGGFQNRNQHPISPQSTCEQRAEQPKPRNNPKAKSTVRTIHDRYHNPDPIVRLIGKRNESKVIVDGIEYPGLLDSGAQMSIHNHWSSQKNGTQN